MPRNNTETLPFLLLLLFLAPVFPEQAQAYMDPGSGSALVYVLISIVSAVYFVAKGLYYRLSRRKMPSTPSIGRGDDIAILSEGKIYQTTYQPVIEALIDRGQAFTYLTMDISDPLLEIEHPLMNSRYIGEGAGAYLRTLRVSAKILLSTTPHIGIPGYPLPKPRKVGCMAHVFHATGMGHYYRKRGLDQYNALLLQSMKLEPPVRKLESVRKLPARSCFGIGIPYYDILLRNFTKRENRDNRPAVGVGSTILIAPTWGKKGILALCANTILPRLMENGYRIILRPHPQSYSSDADILTSIFSRFGNNSLLRIDQGASAEDSMFKSTMMISDMSGIRFDYAFVYGKPVLTIKNLAYTEDLEIDIIGGDEPWEALSPRNIGDVIGAEEADSIVNHIQNAMTTSNGRIVAFRNEWVDNFGHAGVAVADWLIATKNNF